jgi:DNA-binding NtrC family response regulator
MIFDRAPKILAIDDDATWLEQIPLIFEGSEYEVHTFSNIDQGLIAIENSFYDVVLLDLNFSGDRRTGLDVFRKIVAKDAEVDVIVISGETLPKRLIEIMNAGITHFIPKPASTEEIRRSVIDSVRRKRIRRDSVLLNGKSTSLLIGSSSLALNLKADIIQAAKVGVKDILIQGETGTGKEIVARGLAEAADPSKRFHPVHCAAINDGVAESELFGHIKGAFTGADKDRVGAFESAQGGFVFLDEIGDMPIHQQAKLLRVLKERKVQRVGSIEERVVSFKSISATHVNLESAVADKRFREDLFYRIAKYIIKIPSLRERMEDVPELVTFFLSTRFKNEITITPQAVDLLFAYHWPGNIRQLESVVETMAYRCEKKIIRERDVCQALPELSSVFTTRAPVSFLGKTGHALISQERKRFQKALLDASGDRSRAAGLLNISRATFFRRAKELGLVAARKNEISHL